MSAAAQPLDRNPAAGVITIRNLDSLLDQIANPQLLEQGLVNIVGIAPVREKLADRWERSRDNIYERIEKQLGRQLGAADYQIRISETEYLLSLPGDTRQSAQLRCMRILQELLELFLGQFTLEQIDIRAVTKRHGDQLVAEAVDIAALHSAATRGATAPQPAAAPIGQPVKVAPKLSIDPIRVGNRTLHLDFEFRPLWDLRHDAISSFSLNAIPETDQSRSLGEARADRSQLTPEELTAIDLASVKHGLETLTYLFQKQNRFILHLPCSYETLASSRARPQFLDAIKSFAPELRRYIAFELHDLPSGVPQSRLSALVTMLNPFGRGVIATIRAQRAGSMSLRGCGLLGTAVELEPAGLPESEIFVRIGNFRERAHMTGDQMLAYGVNTRSLVMACWSMGLTHVSGDAIAPACAMPYQMSRFRPLDLYRA
ncbi:MAG TPA: hypothetical protein VHD95_01690 [Rhizomicrobium sp.]|nr:hypothetical protein [Rhizomicrobium sp.]